MQESASSMTIPASARILSRSEGQPPRPILIGAGACTMGPNLSWDWNRQATWLFECFMDQALEIRTRDQGWRTFEAGTAVLYPPNTSFRERLPSGSDSCHSYSLFFDDQGYAPLCEHLGGAPLAWRIEDPDGLVRRLFKSIEQAMDPGPGAGLMIDGCFTQLIAALLRGDQRDQSVVIGSGHLGEPPFVSRAHRFMRRNMAKPLQIADIAGHVGMSDSGFSHAYRRATGSTPMSVLRSTRIEAAKALMLRSHTGLEEVAVRTGFSDAFHFSRTFKQWTGSSPTAYRRSIIGRTSAS